jgi:hypothetical protein
MQVGAEQQRSRLNKGEMWFTHVAEWKRATEECRALADLQDSSVVTVSGLDPPSPPLAQSPPPAQEAKFNSTRTFKNTRARLDAELEFEVRRVLRIPKGRANQIAAGLCAEKEDSCVFDLLESPELLSNALRAAVPVLCRVQQLR